MFKMQINDNAGKAIKKQFLKGVTNIDNFLMNNALYSLQSKTFRTVTISVVFRN